MICDDDRDVRDMVTAFSDAERTKKVFVASAVQSFLWLTLLLSVIYIYLRA